MKTIKKLTGSKLAKKFTDTSNELRAKIHTFIRSMKYDFLYYLVVLCLAYTYLLYVTRYI